MRQRAAEFGAHLDRVKAETEGPEWGWYQWKMLPTFIENFDSMLTGENRELLEKPRDTHIADIGAADGDLAFFLESIGFTADIIDGGDPSINELRLLPPRILKQALGSGADIFGVDLDREFKLPREYHLVFCLGVLYHLKNPFLLLETLARSTHYCILSTKVARYVQMPGRLGRRTRVDISATPLAYLLDPYEVSETDPTNYWVFSETGLRRLVARAGWTVLDYHTVGNVTDAEPASQYEARAWCLLRSNELEPGPAGNQDNR
jgi:hypothetical protein